ncbi:hypothetical protein SISSUDRAFT_182479 [Sistotremastrum suecicum HHB10207 ss-3]|uniref:Uncharacterized protein n=1 Tax=Sistotremastrum suecicum HHB10207 ss-3 TaxID=1314776 RepID=A0A166AHA2_9AGAM|nr:hypothetical protein SISSUDRAFT_182479 [Sistotremastrum suecicum HHB10207 ss-3]
MLNPSLHLTQTLDSIINVNPSMRRYRNRKLLIIVIACLFLCASHHSESRNPEADSFALCPVPHPSLRSQRRPHNTWLKDPAFRFRSASTRTTQHASHTCISFLRRDSALGGSPITRAYAGWILQSQRKHSRRY